MIIHINNACTPDMREHLQACLRKGDTSTSIQQIEVQGACTPEDFDLSFISVFLPKELNVDKTTGTGRVLRLEDEEVPFLGAHALYSLLNSGLEEPSFTGLDHLKKYNEDKNLGPILTFDGTLFRLRMCDEKSSYILGCRYIKNADHFFVIPISLYMHRSFETQRLLYSLRYQ